MSIFKPIEITYSWDRENFEKAFTKSYTHQFKNSARRYVGWFFVALAQFGVIHMVDFKENFWEMKHYVYDSACLQCHHMVKEPEKAIGLADNVKELHQKYYWDAKKAGKDVSCVNCHNDYTMSHFAHPNLLEALEEEE